MNYSEFCAAVVNGLRVFYVGMEEDMVVFCKVARINQKFVKKVWNVETVQGVCAQDPENPDYVAVYGTPNPQDWRNTREITQMMFVKGIPIMEASDLISQALTVNPVGYLRVNGHSHHA